MELNIS